MILALLLVTAAAYVWISGGALPPTVASHFDASGVANGFMPRSSYLGLMLIVTLGVPLLIAITGAIASHLPARLVNVPHRDYWLAEERRATTVATLATMSTSFASALLVFLCFVHWLVLRANAGQPPRFDSSLFLVGLVAFMVVTFGGLAILVLRFASVPRGTRTR